MGDRALRWWERSFVVWTVFGLASIWLGWRGYTAEAIPYGDVSFVYEFWATQAITGGPIVGLETIWVYPVVALIPILLPLMAGTGSYAIGWIVMVTLVNAAAIAVLLYVDTDTDIDTDTDTKSNAPTENNHSAGYLQSRYRRRQIIAAWWWIAFLVFLGPIAVARLDTVVTPLVIIGLVLLAKRPFLAASIITIATWIKVWPAAVLMSMVAILAERRKIVIASLITTAVIMVLALMLGGANSILSFLTEQTSRGLQIEAPLATPFLWLVSAGVAGYEIYYDTDILTFQVRGEGTDIVSMISSLVLGAAFVGALVFGWRVSRTSGRAHEILPALVLLLTTILIVFNKVGSPQYIGWLAAPIVAGIIVAPSSYRAVSWIVLGLALLTNAFYPDMYQGVLAAQPFELGVLTLRNIAEILLLLLSFSITVKVSGAGAQTRSRLES